jgi:toxin-antitoxin system PIN domain toxin
VIHLLDVNVLVALAWPNHVHHAAATTWFLEHHPAGWATCPVTQSGFIRVSSNRRVLPDARSPADAAALLRRYLELPGHSFWPDDVALAAAPEVDLTAVQGYRQVTDVHLLVLTARHEGRLVTFDRSLAATGIADVVPLSMG